MSLADKAKNVVQQTIGKAEEAVGKRTDDAELTAQGEKDQSMGCSAAERGEDQGRRRRRVSSKGLSIR